MSQIIPIYIPTYISSIDYQPTRVLPRLLFFNGLLDCEPYYIVNDNTSVEEQTQFPYFDNYLVQSGSQFPTTGSKSLLFFNEETSYGQTPTGSLYSEYWEEYVQLLYNPRTRLVNASAIIPLADYFEIELNDLVEFRGNYYHLRAINDYNLKNGECAIQLLGPILPQSLPFAQEAQPIAPTTTTSTTTTTTTSTTTTTTTSTTTTTEPPLSCTEYTFDGSISGASLTAFWVDCESGIGQSQFVPVDTIYGPVCARTGTANGQAFTTDGDCTPTTTTSTTTTTAPPETELYVYARYINSNGTLQYSLNFGPTIEIGALGTGCSFMTTIPCSVGDEFLFSDINGAVIALSTSVCPDGPGGFACDVSYSVLSSGAQYVYITINGSTIC